MILMFGTGYVPWVELPIQRRLCPIFVRDVGSPDIHECFRRLTGCQRTPGDRGVTFVVNNHTGLIPINLISVSYYKGWATMWAFGGPNEI